MQKLKRLLGAASLTLSLCLLQPTPAAAIVIQFQATDLGQDLWKYDYFVSGFDFAVDGGFSIFFNPLQYKDLHASLPDANPAPNSTSDSHWDVVLVPPQPLIPADGAYDALALVDHASLEGPFSVSFTWLGPDTPGSQRFERYHLGGVRGDMPMIDGSGQTSALENPVPEPSTLLLMGSGLALALKRRRRSS